MYCEGVSWVGKELGIILWNMGRDVRHLVRDIAVHLRCGLKIALLGARRAL